MAIYSFFRNISGMFQYYCCKTINFYSFGIVFVFKKIILKGVGGQIEAVGSFHAGL